MESKYEDDILYETFDSLADFADVAEERMGRDAIGRPAKTWNGNSSFAMCLDYARHGWHAELGHAMEIAEDAVKSLERGGIIQNFSNPKWDVSGGVVDVGRYLSGEPECMMEMPLNDLKGRAQTIVLVKSFTFLRNVTGEAMADHGRMIVSLALALERMGIPLEIWADRPLANSRRSTTERYCQRVLIKGANDYMDAGQLMFAFVHPGMLRQLGFAVHHSASPRQRTAAQQRYYGEGAILTETIPADSDPKEFLAAELKRMGLTSE